ncbi:unnamed protein product [Microthlaspi erraticum]|uniref:Uncharacterized protein n=1 Tax=Microthlaspi erraticum TaxID=1685480 RepID=A0A6D2J2C6_9BRAS|nr:unnamed protein product [Microthlaspi erraticum]
MQALPRNDPHRGDHHSSSRSNPCLKVLQEGFRKKEQQLEAQLDRAKSKLDRATGSSGVLLMAVSLSRPRPCLPVLWGALRSFGAFWSIWDVRSMEGLGMDAAQLDTQRKKEEAILKTSSTTYSTNRSSSSTRPAKLQLDRAEKSTEEGGSHLEDQLDHLLDHPVEFLNSTGQASTRSS